MTRSRLLRRRHPAAALAGRRIARPGRMLILAAIAVLLAAPAGAAVLRQLAPDAPSPARGHAAVVAHGVAALPTGQLAWRVVEDLAEGPDDAPIQERALGFALADAGAVLVNDLGAGTQARLAAGEAAFVPAGAQQQRASLGPAPTPYYRLALVAAADAADDGGDRLLFAGEPFAVPARGGGGRGHDLDLVRDVLGPNEASELPDVGFPTLVLATAGEVQVETFAGDPAVTLAAGEAAAFDGDLVVVAGGNRGASFVAALVGPEVPPLPTPSVGSVTLFVVGCPPGLGADAATPRRRCSTPPAGRSPRAALTRTPGRTSGRVCPTPTTVLPNPRFPPATPNTCWSTSTARSSIPAAWRCRQWRRTSPPRSSCSGRMPAR